MTKQSLKVTVIQSLSTSHPQNQAALKTEQSQTQALSPQVLSAKTSPREALLAAKLSLTALMAQLGFTQAGTL